ncbi:alpha-L-glutamate ligase [Nocardioides guangzhouensis]|uniref:Alpha-L-glutamate ligase n=1 Tax=Nocardioides guangzhouensis TaxID=2497878 RepID=A0A4Q4ZK93_9ACTN|nr:alpha-L-glutamate ligase [Nocardioides guangzhouensis]RYP88285.1 alpha-L-glutamate ligase [Nocardioides guangzhouensis]
MIVLVGVRSEAPVQMAMDAARDLGVDFTVLDERDAANWHVDLRVDPSGTSCTVSPEGRTIELGDVDGVYLRLVGAAPHARGARVDPCSRARHQAAVSLLTSWAQTTRARVANRPEPMCSNASKPYQAALIAAAGLQVPATLVSNDPDEVRGFAARHGRLVFKSTSGIRSVVQELTPARAAALDQVRFLPTQFQQLVSGTNVRAHVVADRVFACSITSTSIDYRYGGEGMTPQTVTATELPHDVDASCRSLAKTLDLPLVGIDLIHDDDGNWWCLEANTSPAYSCFEQPTGLPIARALVAWLDSGRPA